MKTLLLACHREAGAARRETSQALNRFREPIRESVIEGHMFGGSLNLQLRGPSARYASLGMTRSETAPHTTGL
jgi:hypothetical protein